MPSRRMFLQAATAKTMGRHGYHERQSLSWKQQHQEQHQQQYQQQHSKPGQRGHTSDSTTQQNFARRLHHTNLSQLTDGKGRAVARRDGHDPPPPQRRRAPRHAQALEGAGPAVLLRVYVVVLVVRRNLVLVHVVGDRARVIALRDSGRRGNRLRDSREGGHGGVDEVSMGVVVMD